MKHHNLIQEDTFIIRDLETLKILAEQVRLQIFEALLLQPQTIRAVAGRLGFAPKKLYYHFSLLEQHGLIKVSSTTMVGNLQEKQYAPTATNLAVHPGLLSSSGHDENRRAWLASRLDVTREDILRSLEANPVDIASSQSPRYGKLLLSRSLCRLSTERAEEFRQRFEDLLAEFDAADTPDALPEAALETYALTLAYYPIHHFAGEEKPVQPGEDG